MTNSKSQRQTLHNTAQKTNVQTLQASFATGTLYAKTLEIKVKDA